MGKILVIQGADFSTNKIETVKIRPKDWIDYEIYISSVEEIENPEYKVVYLDSDNKILYGITVENEIIQPEYDKLIATDRFKTIFLNLLLVIFQILIICSYSILFNYFYIKYLSINYTTLLNSYIFTQIINNYYKLFFIILFPTSHSF